MGTHIVDIGGALYKKRVNKKGQVLSQASMFDNFVSRDDFFKRIRTELDEKQGCKIEGYFTINRVPGSFHISSHAFTEAVRQMKSEGYQFDYSYHLKHLSFGKQEDLIQI